MAVKSYRWNDKTQLSPHFNVQEFRCKDGIQHDILIADELWQTLEKLFTSLECGYITINSGHRCQAHDKAVGGSGAGYHVSGYAADIRCYDKHGKIISSKLVCCAAQDVGFGGIANIDASYQNTHVDCRPSGRWYGNEVVTTAYSVTDDFYRYYGVAKPSQQKPAVLKEGDEGPEVEMLQSRLHALGYMLKEGINGKFDLVTLGAVLAFQMKNKLTVDGICGPATIAALEK